MKKFISSNYWWITSTILLISSIVQLLIYKIAYSSAYPWSIFYTVLVVFAAIPLIAKKKKWSILSIALSVLLSFLVIANKPMYTISEAKEILLTNDIFVSRVMVMDGVSEQGDIKIYLFLTSDDMSVYFNPYSGDYYIGTAEKYVVE